MKPKTPKRLRLPRSPTPFAVAVLAIDPGATSGWSIALRGIIHPEHAGTLSAEDGLAMAGIVAEAAAVAAEAGLPLIVAAEKWSAGGWLSTDALLGLGASWGAWRSVLLDARIPKTRIVRVLPQTWRAGLQLRRATDGSDVEPWKATTRRYVLQACGLDLPHDASDAVAIALWASQAPDVALALPRRDRVHAADALYLVALDAATIARKEYKNANK